MRIISHTTLVVAALVVAAGSIICAILLSQIVKGGF